MDKENTYSMLTFKIKINSIPPNSSDDLCLLFCIYPSSMLSYLWLWSSCRCLAASSCGGTSGRMWGTGKTGSSPGLNSWAWFLNRSGSYRTGSSPGLNSWAWFLKQIRIIQIRILTRAEHLGMVFKTDPDHLAQDPHQG